MRGMKDNGTRRQIISFKLKVYRDIIVKLPLKIFTMSDMTHYFALRFYYDHQPVQKINQSHIKFEQQLHVEYILLEYQHTADLFFQ